MYITAILSIFILSIDFISADSRSNRLSLINEIQENAWAYVPRTRFKAEVELCDVVSHDETFTVKNKVNILTTSDANKTNTDRVEIGERMYFYRRVRGIRYGGDAFPRFRKTILETQHHRMANFLNCKLRHQSL